MRHNIKIAGDPLDSDTWYRACSCGWTGAFQVDKSVPGTLVRRSESHPPISLDDAIETAGAGLPRR